MKCVTSRCEEAGWEECMEEDVARHSQLDATGRVGDEPAAVRSDVTAERSCRTEEAGQPRPPLTYNLTNQTMTKQCGVALEDVFESMGVCIER